MMRSESIEAAAAALAGQVAAAVREAVRERGAASLLVPGGRTPVPFFHALRSQDLPWNRVLVSLTDERWVSSGHVDSNARLVRSELLVDAAAAAAFVPLHHAAHTAADGALESWHRLCGLPRPFDAVVLGMGEDGHFASLFPGCPGVAAALDETATPGCVAMQAPSAPTDRLSLNLAALADSRRLFLFITGVRKLGLIESRTTRAALPIDALLSVRDPEPVVYWAP